MGKPKLDEAAQQAALEEGAARMVARRLTSRDKPWTPNLTRKGYQMGWTDISVFDPEMVEAQVRKQCADHGMPFVTVERDVEGFAMRLTIPEQDFRFHARARLEVLRGMPEGKKRDSIAGQIR